MRLLKSRLDPAFLERPIAHRALHDKAFGRVENSRSAFLAAIELGLPIECDVQATRDGRAVVFHDAELDRMTTQSGNVAEFSSAQLYDIYLKGSTDRIESLADILLLVDGQVPLLVEVKDQDGALGPKQHDFLNDIIALTDAYSQISTKHQIALMSFNPYIISELRIGLPEIALGLVTDDFVNDRAWRFLPRARAERLNARDEVTGLDYDFISHNIAYLEQIRDELRPKLCWTVKSKRAEQKAREIADNITFEGYDPEWLISHL